MTAQAPELAAVVARLEKVEQQNRRLKTVGIVVLALAVAGMVMGQAMPRARIVEAEGFVLKDGAGKVRAKLYVVGKDGPGLALLDENGKDRAWLGVGKYGPRLTVYDENGKDRVGLGVSKYGAGLTVYDENGKDRAWLGVGKYGPRLVQYDENGKTIWSTP